MRDLALPDARDDAVGHEPATPDADRPTPPAGADASDTAEARDADLTAAARRTLDRAIARLLGLQNPDGYWCGELEGDSILQSEYLLMMWIISAEDDPRLPKIANYLRMQQREDGGWAQYPGGRVGGGAFDLSATVKAYFALKLMGDDPDAPHMKRARRLILEHGGAERVNSFSKFYLACLGQVSYDAVPTIPPQLIYLPKWFYFHLSKVSAWSRTMIAPLAIVTTQKPVRELPAHLHIDELFADPANRHRLLPTGFGKSRAWTRFFLGLDRALKLADRVGLLKLGRRRALQHMEDWLVEHCEGSDGPGAIFPPIVYLLIAFRTCRGYAADHPLIRENHRHLDNYMIHGLDGTPRNRPEDAPPEDETIRLQPCESPVWDTGIAAYALTDCGFDGGHEALRRCAAWLVSKECRKKADWVAHVKRDVDFSGWFFEFNNPWYPDVDDTVMVSMALKRIGTPEALAAAKRSLDWVLAMQNDDGGWAAFDRTKDRPLYDCVPFADHNAMQDPSCPDITGRTLECLGWHGLRADHPAVQRAIAFIRSRQEPDGCWFGRWGVNYIYGTWQVVGGLRRVGYDMTQPWVRRAGDWLKVHQNDDGSFGESADSYEDPSLRGQGPPTASQTAWGAMALMAVFGPDDPAVHHALRWLCETQRHDGPEAGGWHEPWFTGTGFPRVFYLRYHLYRLYFPVMALGRWLSERANEDRVR